ncbi:Glycoside hydrolase, partial [Lasiodiplodia theobromae]|uniref:Glycoside hydrolase n=1 Tax=Lasiodiplodia theobromae TaxID=45133 RepID=UPI0015C401D7
MTTYAFDDAELAKLKDKTILIIGASSGIGLETVKLAHRNGAKVAIGDWNDAAGQALASELKDRVLFRKCDVSSWPDVLSLFQAAHDTFGPLDAVLSNAGINREDFLADSFDAATGELLPPDLKVLDVNLVGAVYAVKCAVHFFAKRQTEVRCQIVLTGSAASFLDTPPLHLYCASKAGILGLMRGLRTQLVRRNIVSLFAPPPPPPPPPAP